MSELQIITNHHRRHTLYWHDLTPKEQQEFDYLDNPDEYDYIRYRNWVYCMGDFMRIDKRSPFDNYWHGYSSDSFFSGILIHYCTEEEQNYDMDQKVIMATYIG